MEFEEGLKDLVVIYYTTEGDEEKIRGLDRRVLLEMKVKEAEIRVGSIEDLKKAVGETIRQPPASDRTILFVRDAKTISKILSEKRLELMRAIKEHPSYNVTMLANLLKRKQEAVSRDLGVLKRFGLVELEKTAKEVTPEIKSTKVMIEI